MEEFELDEDPVVVITLRLAWWDVEEVVGEMVVWLIEEGLLRFEVGV